MRRTLGLLMMCMAIGCGSEPATGAGPGPAVGGKADGVDAAPELFYVQNDLDQPVRVLLGDSSVYDAWTSGSSEPGVWVDAHEVSALDVYSADVVGIAALDESGAPLSPDALTGAIERDEEGRVVLALVVGEAQESDLEPLEDYVPEYISANGEEALSETYSGDGAGYSDSTTTAYGWVTDTAKRDQLKREARAAAWRSHRRSDAFKARWDACRAAGGRDLYTSSEDCSYMPIDPFVWFETECRASCTFGYRCLR